MTGESNAKSGGDSVVYGTGPVTKEWDGTSRTITFVFPQNIKKLCGFYQKGTFQNGDGFAIIYPSQASENECVKVYADASYPGTLWQTSNAAFTIQGNKMVITEEDYNFQPISQFFDTAYTYIPE